MVIDRWSLCSRVGTLVHRAWKQWPVPLSFAVTIVLIGDELLQNLIGILGLSLCSTLMMHLASIWLPVEGPIR